MINDSLVWAAVPHNNDGVVFQIRLEYGLQRFYPSRGVLEQVFELERRASDSRQLEVFYIYLNRIIAMASAKRSIASADTMSLKSNDFSTRNEGVNRSASDDLMFGTV